MNNNDKGIINKINISKVVKNPLKIVIIKTVKGMNIEKVNSG